MKREDFKPTKIKHILMKKKLLHKIDEFTGKSKFTPTTCLITIKNKNTIRIDQNKPNG